MPRGRGYGRRRRLPETAIVRRSAGRIAGRAAGGVHPLVTALEIGAQYGHNLGKIAQAFGKMKAHTTGLKQTGARPRGRPKGSKSKSKSRGTQTPAIQRHEKLKTASGKPTRKGKGLKGKRGHGPKGRLVTHPYSTIPKWKRDRIKDYKYDVYQTVLCSRSGRLAASNNTLASVRHPLKMPECLDDYRTQTVMFTPFCSNFSGMHTTWYQKIRTSDGADFDHDNNNYLDVIQNKADADRLHTETSTHVDGADANFILYKNDTHSATAVASAGNQGAILRKFDQLFKGIHLDLVFIASRAFPVKISVSVVRQIKPAAPYTLTTDNKRELCNSVNNDGVDYHDWVTEYYHEFTLPALRVNKKIPTYEINKELVTNFMQTNSFAENTVAQDMTEAATTVLGQNIHSHVDDIADGNMSGNVYILIKYRKIQKLQQFTYTQNIDMNRSDHAGGTAAVASVELPVVSEESLNIPVHDGDGTGSSSGGETGGTITGSPFTSDQGDESKACFYMNGKIKYKWGFRNQVEPVPSLMSHDDNSTHYKKPLSLNIDPTQDGTNTTYGMYQQSAKHVNIAADTSV
jgi:hypothetical protein